MSAAHPWPVGVPELPPLDLCVLWTLTVPKDANEPGVWCPWANIERQSAGSEADSFARPAVVVVGKQVVHANAAARALGIIPHGGSASGADGEGKG